MHNQLGEQQAPSVWTHALRAAAHLVSPRITAQDDLLRELQRSFQRLHLRGFVSLQTSEGKLCIQAHGLSHSLIDTIRRIMRQDFIGCQFDPNTVHVYEDVIKTGEPRFISDRDEALRGMLPLPLPIISSRLYRIMGQGQIIVAPLTNSEGVFGTLTLISAWLTAADLPHAEDFAKVISAALIRVRDLEESEACRRREYLRNRVIETLAGEQELHRALNQILSLTSESIHADAAAIALLDASSGMLEFSHYQNLPDSLMLKPVSLGEDPLSRSIQRRQTILLHPLRADRKAPAQWIKAGVNAFLSVPLIAGEEILGALVLCSLRDEPGFSGTHIHLVQAIASIMSIVVWNERLYSRAQERAHESYALIQTAKSISSSLDQETVLHEIAQQAKVLLDADGSRIHLYTKDRSRLHCVLALGPYAEALMAHDIQHGEGITGACAARGEAALVNDLRQHPEHLTIPGIPWNRDEYLALAPLSIRQQIMGTMTVTRNRIKSKFLPQDLELLKAFAAHAAIALENANLYAEIESQALRLESEVEARTEELALSESRYRALVETSLAGIIQLDINAHVSYANQVFADLVGVELEAVLHHPLPKLGILSPASLEMVLQRFEERMKGHRPPQGVYEVELQHVEGRLIPALLAVSLLLDNAGQPNGISALVVDISDRKQLEADLRAERDRLDALLTNIGDAVVVTDPDGYIEYVNPAWERQNQYTSAEVIGKKTSIIRSGKHPPSFYKEMWDSILAGETWRGEVINLRRDGEMYDASLTITPMVADEGRIISIVGVQHDISSLKEVDRLKTDFVSDVSHELRTPLTNIRLYLELLAHTTDSDRQEMYTSTLFRESGRLAVLIEDLLALSRLDAGAVPHTPIMFDINQMLAELIDDRRPLAQMRQLTLHYNPDPRIPGAYGDPQQLIQVFSNLLTNAMNYTQENGDITIQTHIGDDPSDLLQIDVIDTGLGIPAEEQDLIFQRFFRGRASRQTGVDGTGLGLAICHDIVQMHHGKIAVQSEGSGEGSTFSVWLPLHGGDETSP